MGASLDTNQFGGSFWISFVGLMLSFFAGLSIYCLKSKCKKCSICFGLIKVERDITSEIEEEKMELEKGIPYISQNQSK